MKLAILAAAFTLTASIAHAQAGCDAQKVIMDAARPVIAQSASIATEIARLGKEQMALTNPNAPPKEPIGNSMNKDQVEDFGELRARIIALKLAGLVNSEYERDLIVSSFMLDVAKKRYEGRELATEDQQYAAVLDGLNANINDNSLHFEADGHCNLSTAISPLIAKLNAQINDYAPKLGEDQRVLSRMAQKYNVKLADLMNTDISPQDSLTVAPIYSQLKLMARTVQYASDLIHIDGYDEASQTLYETRIKAMGAMAHRRML